MGTEAIESGWFIFLGVQTKKREDISRFLGWRLISDFIMFAQSNQKGREIPYF